MNRKQDADHWDSEKKRKDEAKQKQSEMHAALMNQIEEKKNLKSKADQHEVDFNKRYLDSISTVKSHLKEEIKTKEQVIVPKTGGKKQIPHPSSSAVGLPPGPASPEERASSPGSKLLNF